MQIFGYRWKRTAGRDGEQGGGYPILSSSDAPIVMSFEIPLVQSGHCERGFPL